MPETVRDLLSRTSRTFALAIPLLAEPTRTALAMAYLFFRVADTVEDAATWSKNARVAALRELVVILRTGSKAGAQRASRRWLAEAITTHPGYHDLIAAFPALLEELSTWQPARAALLREHAARTAEGMAHVLLEADAAGHLRLTTLSALRNYCYVVAGIVGELVTALFLFDEPKLQAVKSTLVANERAFGEALQLVNILKDERADAEEGRVYLPPGVPRQELIALARADLIQARAYIQALRDGGAPPGFVAFTSLPAELATRALKAVEDRGTGAKVARDEVLALLKQFHGAMSNAPS
ncbi:MAG TPA: squalene/phytoene synthase family protein [Polyangiaceae bacterium]|jgi:farnesyl-diphosphate farnesyltransferase|nr:squalene/phytoene synthase family protein [Polyangiaceae bacterium]